MFEGLVSVIHQRTDGNPFFMINVVDYLMDAGIMDAGLRTTSQKADAAE